MDPNSTSPLDPDSSSVLKNTEMLEIRQTLYLSSILNMKKTLLILIAVCALAMSSHAQTLKIITVDIAKLFEGYYKTQQAGEKIRLSLEKAQEQDNALVDELKRMAEVFNEVKERSENPALTDEARQQARPMQMLNYKKFRECNRIGRIFRQILSARSSSAKTLTAN